MTKYPSLQVNTDGGSRGNPGPSAIGIVISSNQEVVYSHSEYIGNTTNNVAEYTAVIKALNLLLEKELFAESCHFVLDSELIVKQINGQYKVKQEHLQKLNTEIKKIINICLQQKVFNKIVFSHVLRDKNKEADKLVNLALDSQ